MRVKVLITIDTEIWPRYPNWRETDLEREFSGDFLGHTVAWDYGVPFKIDLLNRHGLKAVFLVESLLSTVVGDTRLGDMVDVVVAGGQEVQLHAHPEWLRLIDSAGAFPTFRGPNLYQYPLEEQRKILELSKRAIERVGAPRCTAFRAGNYGADRNTLSALSDVGILFDTSYNAPYLGRGCEVRVGEQWNQAQRVDGIAEFPISFVRDGFGALRHCQLGAISLSEMCSALEHAYTNGWKHFVIVSHSFELVHRAESKGAAVRPPFPNRVTIDRFVGLCEFLSTHRDRFETVWFSELDLSSVDSIAVRPIPRSTLVHTVARTIEQAKSRYIEIRR